MRKLKLSNAAIKNILDQLDEEEQRESAPSRSKRTRFPYRVSALTVKVKQSQEQVVSYLVPTRNIGRDGITFLISNLVNAGDTCTLDLITLRNNWQSVSGRVISCRYIPGSAYVHEARVEFDHAIDPASFAPTAVRARILIADDSLMARRLLSHLLSTLNVEIICVEDGIEAVKVAQEQPFDLILMDIEMPELDGISAVRILRGKGYARAIVGISSQDADDVREKCLEAGCDDFIAKPPQRDSLETVVNRTKPEPLVSALLHQHHMHPLIDEFVAGLPQRIKELESAFAAQDMKWLTIEVRKLKGEASGFGFEPITALATDAENAITKELPLTQIRLELSKLMSTCLAARPATCQESCPSLPLDQETEVESQDEETPEEAPEETPENITA